MLLQLFPSDERASLRRTTSGTSGGAGLYVHIAPGSRLAAYYRPGHPIDTGDDACR